MMGMKRARTIALPPWRSKNSCALAMSRIDPPPPAWIDLRASDDPRADRAADRIIHRVAGDRRRDQQRQQDADVERAVRGQRTSREEQRIARQNRCDDEAGLGEDDGEQHPVNPPTVGLDEIEQEDVGVKNQIDEVGHL
jgi:hypothetical protein